MERPYIGKSKNELIALAGSGDAAAQAELDYRANRKGRSTPPPADDRLDRLERALARCEEKLDRFLELLEDELENEEE